MVFFFAEGAFDAWVGFVLWRSLVSVAEVERDFGMSVQFGQPRESSQSHDSMVSCAWRRRSDTKRMHQMESKGEDYGEKRTMVKGLRCNSAAFPRNIVEYKPTQGQSISSTIPNYRKNRTKNLAGLFLCVPVALYSFSGALHSVLNSEDIGNLFKNACCAECMASAGLMPLSFMRSRMGFEMSSHKPVEVRSQGGMSTSTTSRMTFRLGEAGQYGSLRRMRTTYRSLK